MFTGNDVCGDGGGGSGGGGGQKVPLQETTPRGTLRCIGQNTAFVGLGPKQRVFCGEDVNFFVVTTEPCRQGVKINNPASK